MRHGKAESDAASDMERSLTDKGHSQARLIGDYLRAQGVKPSRVLVSTAARTQETWSDVHNSLGDIECDVSVLDDLYHGGVRDVLRIVRGVDESSKVLLVVGHEPTMSQLAAYLGNDDRSDSAALAQVRIGVPTGSMSVLTSSAETWQDIAEEELDLLTLVRG
ncbi:phosphoglycerate mutase family protein [Mycobacteroides abscessus subsp. abscessus]|uniref:Phosphohistidine phosphatase SixA n=2 Tax=Dermabacter vaginalis TaxID=1630135 RepID=A0ABX6A7B7_9MICO|nr:phosphohistidine phosphatase SixA [Dermabacter vaginalis]SHV72759.1 phosphoglycerate mutase family protein [Mycobacteroides abscessus subsp. abscessus]